MRVNFVLSEVATGLRRNLTMTVAMILTTAISLGLMGTGLLIAGMISDMKEIYYDKVQVSIFLADGVTDEQRSAIEQVRDEGDFLDRLFSLLNGARNATIAVAVVQALAALLLISNTIQLAAFNRRNETNIMRLVGASRWYTQLPFILEAALAGLIGALLAIGGPGVTKILFFDQTLAGPNRAGIIPPVDWGQIAFISPVIAAAGVGLAAVAAYVTLRLYVRIKRPPSAT